MQPNSRPDDDRLPFVPEQPAIIKDNLCAHVAIQEKPVLSGNLHVQRSAPDHVGRALIVAASEPGLLRCVQHAFNRDAVASRDHRVQALAHAELIG